MIPQFELPQAEVAFNLASETAQDGERESSERAMRKQQKEEAERKAKREQPDLFQLA